MALRFAGAAPCGSPEGGGGAALLPAGSVQGGRGAQGCQGCHGGCSLRAWSLLGARSKLERLRAAGAKRGGRGLARLLDGAADGQTGVISGGGLCAWPPQHGDSSMTLWDTESRAR